ncbi:hypothetical protein SFRURICE_013747 [Spodoptera frugiperda]|nr:hypothetical protein SFRURICE_013747 [Spodoptera frugiperda]
MTEVAHRPSMSKSTDDVTNILHRAYEVCVRINTDRKSQRTTVGQKARQAEHLAWSEDPPFLRELYLLFPKIVYTSEPSALSMLVNMLVQTFLQPRLNNSTDLPSTNNFCAFLCSFCAGFLRRLERRWSWISTANDIAGT